MYFPHLTLSLFFPDARNAVIRSSGGGGVLREIEERSAKIKVGVGGDNREARNIEENIISLGLMPKIC